MSEREAGWYWTKWSATESWECSEWRGEQWDDNAPAYEPCVVGPRIPAPGEPWQCVPVGWLKNLRSSIAGDCYMGEEWEIATIEAMLAAASKPGGE